MNLPQEKNTEIWPPKWTYELLGDPSRFQSFPSLSNGRAFPFPLLSGFLPCKIKKYLPRPLARGSNVCCQMRKRQVLLREGAISGSPKNQQGQLSNRAADHLPKVFCRAAPCGKLQMLTSKALTSQSLSLPTLDCHLLRHLTE